MPHRVVALGLAAALVWSVASAEESQLFRLKWTDPPPAALPDEHGFAGMFAGVLAVSDDHDNGNGGVLLAAGGANFPEKPLIEGGPKRWSDRIFLLGAPDAAWREAETRLPRPLGYGVSVTWRDRVICIGGNNLGGHRREVFALSLDGGDVAIEALPPLPMPMSMMSGALVGDAVYVAGGMGGDDPTRSLDAFYRLNLRRPDASWKQLPTWPGPDRCLAIAASLDGDFFLVSGMRMAPNEDGAAYPVAPYLVDAYRYDPDGGVWKRLADPPRPLAASPALELDSHMLAVLGGLSGENLGHDLATYPRFYRGIHGYDADDDAWRWLGYLPPDTARLVAPAVKWHGRHVVISGESRPGVRSTAVQFIRDSGGSTDHGK